MEAAFHLLWFLLLFLAEWSGRSRGYNVLWYLASYGIYRFVTDYFRGDRGSEIVPGVTFAQAAALPEVYATAYLNLRIVGEIQKGETFFINGGEGGLGVATIQLAKHVFGAKVVAQVASDENGEFCKGVGADVVSNRFKDDLVKTLTENPPNVAIDPVGGPLMGKCIATMPYRGRWISLASMAGPETTLDVNLLWRKNLRVIGSTLRRRSPEEKAQILAGLVNEVWPAFEARKFAPFVHKVMSIIDTTEAHAILERGENRGKVVLTVRQDK